MDQTRARLFQLADMRIFLSHFFKRFHCTTKIGVKISQILWFWLEAKPLITVFNSQNCMPFKCQQIGIDIQRLGQKCFLIFWYKSLKTGPSEWGRSARILYRSWWSKTKEKVWLAKKETDHGNLFRIYYYHDEPLIDWHEDWCPHDYINDCTLHISRFMFLFI